MLGFGIYGGLFGFAAFLAALFAQVIRKYLLLKTPFAVGIAGVISAILLPIVFSVLKSHQVKIEISLGLICLGLFFGLIVLCAELFCRKLCFTLKQINIFKMLFS